MADYVNKQQYAEQQLVDRDRFFINVLITALSDKTPDNWQEPWLRSYQNCIPQSISGHQYTGANVFFLWLSQMVNDYETPVYITREKAKQLGLKINPEAPVEYINKMNAIYYALDASQVKDLGLPMKLYASKYDKLPKEQKDLFRKVVYSCGWREYNICNTDIKEVLPELYEKIMDRFASKVTRDDSVSIKVKALDKMVAEQSWLCPIIEDRIAEAFYVRSEENPCIKVPKKSDMKSDELYYSTLVHEMIHSTKLVKNADGKPIRTVKPGNKQSYAREELVAEMGAAIVLCELGINPVLADHNKEYLKNWFHGLGAIPEDTLAPNPAFKKLQQQLTELSPERDLSPVLAALATEELSLGQALKSQGLSYDDITPMQQELLELQETERIQPTVHKVVYHQMTPESLTNEENKAQREFITSVAMDAIRAADEVFSKGLKMTLAEIREKGEVFVEEKEVDASKKQVEKKRPETAKSKKRTYTRRK